METRLVNESGPDFVKRMQQRNRKENGRYSVIERKCDEIEKSFDDRRASLQSNSTYCETIVNKIKKTPPPIRYIVDASLNLNSPTVSEVDRMSFDQSKRLNSLLEHQSLDSRPTYNLSPPRPEDKARRSSVEPLRLRSFMTVEPKDPGPLSNGSFRMPPPDNSSFDQAKRSKTPIVTDEVIYKPVDNREDVPDSGARASLGNYPGEDEPPEERECDGFERESKSPPAIDCFVRLGKHLRPVQRRQMRPPPQSSTPPSTKSLREARASLKRVLPRDSDITGSSNAVLVPIDNLQEVVNDDEERQLSLRNSDFGVDDKFGWDKHLDQQMSQQSRVSVGKYFRDKSQSDMLGLNGNFEMGIRSIEPEIEFRHQVENQEEAPVPKEEAPATRPSSIMETLQRTFEEFRSSMSYNTANNIDVESTIQAPISARARGSEERWSHRRRNVHGGVYQTFSDSINHDFELYTCNSGQLYTTAANNNEAPVYDESQIVETPLRASELYNYEYYTDDENKEPFPTIASTATSFLKNNNPIHESTRKLSDDAQSVGLTTTSVLTLVPESVTTEGYQTPAYSTSTLTSYEDLGNAFEAQSFMEEAVSNGEGDNLSCYTFGRSIIGKSNSCFDPSELMSQHQTPSPTPSPQRKEVDKTIAVSDPDTPASSTDSRSSHNLDNHFRARKLTRNFSHKIKKSLTLLSRKSRESDLEKVELREFIDKAMSEEVKERLKELFQESNSVLHRINQARKALNQAKTSKDYASSAQRLEAERLIVIFCIRREAILSEINRLASARPEQDLNARANITISDIKVPLHENEALKRKFGAPVEWFIVVIRSGLVVWGSAAVACPMASPLFFPGEITIPDLTPDFKITVTLYSFVMPQRKEGNHYEEVGDDSIAGDDGKLECKFMTNSNLTNTLSRVKKISRRMSLVLFEPTNKSSFKICGSLDLTLGDIKTNSETRKLTGVLRDSIMDGTIQMNIRRDIHTGLSITGFLTYASHTFYRSPGESSLSKCCSWNRRWCVLEGQYIHLWNSPDEVGLDVPIFTIDMGMCVMERIEEADRSHCAKSKTLMIETCWRPDQAGCRQNCSHSRHFLCFDKKSELERWQDKLNQIVKKLMKWDVIRNTHDKNNSSEDIALSSLV